MAPKRKQGFSILSDDWEHVLWQCMAMQERHVGWRKVLRFFEFQLQRQVSGL